MIANFKDTESLGAEVLDAAMEVHRELGPGMVESTYETCLLHELTSRGLNVRHQVSLPVAYKGIHLDAAYRVDLLLENAVIVEVKSVEQLLPVHHAQILSCLKLSGLNLACLINFNVPLLQQGFHRVVLGASKSKPTSRSLRPLR